MDSIYVDKIIIDYWYEQIEICLLTNSKENEEYNLILSFSYYLKLVKYKYQMQIDGKEIDDKVIGGLKREVVKCFWL